MMIKMKSLYSLLILAFFMGALTSCLPETPQGRRIGSEGLADNDNGNQEPVDNNLPETSYLRQCTLQSATSHHIYRENQNRLHGLICSGYQYIGPIGYPFYE